MRLCCVPRGGRWPWDSSGWCLTASLLPLRSTRRSLVISSPVSPPASFPSPEKAPDWQPAVEAEATEVSPGTDGNATDAISNGELGGTIPGPPPASPASGGSLSETASVSSEEAPEQSHSLKALLQDEGTAVAAAEPGADFPQLPKSQRSEPEEAASRAQAGPEGIATSLASLIVSEAIAQAAGIEPPEPENATAGDPCQPDGTATNSEAPSPASATSPTEQALRCPSPGAGQEPCWHQAAAGSDSISMESVEVMDTKPEVATTQVRYSCCWQGTHHSGQPHLCPAMPTLACPGGTHVGCGGTGLGASMGTIHPSVALLDTPQRVAP